VAQSRGELELLSPAPARESHLTVKTSGSVAVSSDIGVGKAAPWRQPVRPGLIATMDMFSYSLRAIATYGDV